MSKEAFMLKFKLLDVNLRLFDGAAAGGAAGTGTAGTGEGGATAGSEGTSTQATAEFSKKNGSSHRSGRSTGDLSNVIYGKQPETSPDAGGKTDVSTTSDSLEQKRQNFEKLISGEYKDMFTERTQAIIDNRFKQTKTLEGQIAAQQPVINMLMDRYGISDGDLGKLTKALENDDAYWEAGAEEAGLTVEQYKMVQKLQRENAELTRSMRMRQGAEQANRQVAEWNRQANEVKNIYPGFDFRTELGNRDFVQMLKNGIPVQKAYEISHFDEIMNGAAQTAAKNAEKNTVEKIKRKSSRPAENGTSSSSSAIVKSDVHNLTRADRAEIAKRAARGEHIAF